MGQTSSILKDYEIPHSVHLHKSGYKRDSVDTIAYQIQINGEKNVKLFLKKIGFSNKRHLNKVSHLL